MRKVLITSCIVAILFTASYSVEIRHNGARQFVGSDLTGKFELFVKQGSCPKTILHKEFGAVSRGAYQVPHNKIVQEDTTCQGGGSLSVFSKKSIDNAAPEASSILKQGSFKGIIEALEKQSTDFLVGVEIEKRSCGKTSLSAGSLFIFVEDSKQIKIPGLIELFPGAKYMIVYDKNSPTPCTYSAQSSGSVIGEPAPSPKPINAKPAPGGPLPSGNGGSGSGSSTTSSGGSGSAKRSGTSGATADASTSNSETGESSGVDNSEAIEGTTDAPSTEPGAESSQTSSGESTSAIGETEESTSSSESEGTPIVGIPDSESFPSESEEPSSGSACFSKDSLVNIEGGSFKKMSELSIGDFVSIGSGKYSRIFMFTHKSADVVSGFVRISTESNDVIEVTPGHYIYSNNELVDASTVKLGDMLTLENGVQSAVKQVSYTKKSGIYNPQTEQGDIVVNGILASTFTKTINPDVAQSLLAPFRSAFKAFGATCNLFNDGAKKLSQVIQ